MMEIEELNIEIGMAIELKEYYFNSRETSPFSNLMFQYWCGVEIGLCLASERLRSSLTESFYGMPYREYYNRAINYFRRIAEHERLLDLCSKGLIP